jgi:hypothetical protein
MRYHKMWASAFGLRMGLSGEVVPQNGGYAGFGKRASQNPLPCTSLNKGERMSCWEATGRDEGSVPIMGLLCIG